MRASSQYTPMVLRIYRAAIPPKLFVGLILSTTLFLILSLLTLNFSERKEIFLPVVVMDFALLTVCFFSIPPLLDYLVRSLEPTYLAAQVLSDLRELVDKENSSKEQNLMLEVSQDRSFLERANYSIEIQNTSEGYLQSVDYKKLAQIGCEENLTLAVPYRLGEFILQNAGLVYVNADSKLSPSTVKKIKSCFILGSERVKIGDLELQLEELVYITLAALSPGVNDFSTALHCISSVTAACNMVVNFSFKPGVYKDEKERPRVFAKEFDFEGFMHCAFDRIRVAVRKQPSVAQYVLNNLHELSKNCVNRERVKVLEQIASQTIEDCKEQCIDYELGKMQSVYKLLSK